MNKNITVVLLLVLAAGCSSTPQDGAYLPPMDPTRKVSEQECTKPINSDGNLMCREVTAAERRARIAEEERDGGVLLVNFVNNYGKVEKNRGIAGQITTSLAKARNVNPCPPA